MTPQAARPVRASEIKPVLPDAAWPTADWADAFEVEYGSGTTDMTSLARQTVGAMPKWARALLALRNILVAPFGLKADGATDAVRPENQVGMFPILHQSQDRIVLGLDDKHLDFRIVLERIKTGDQHMLRATTLVTRHNLFGRFYISIVTPFHKRIVKSVLQNAH